MEPLDTQASRRDFLNWSWRLAGLLGIGQAAYFGLRFFTSRRAEGTLGGVVTAGVVDDFPPGSLTVFNNERFFLVRFDDGGFLALSTRCTHLACVVSWNEPRRRFLCPCHGSEFDRDGAVLNPPAPRPLDRFPVLIEDDRVKVDTGQRIQRDTAEPDVLVYAADAIPTPPPRMGGYQDWNED